MGGNGLGIGNIAQSLTGAAGPLGALAGGALGQVIEKCACCLKALKDKLCECCAGGLKELDERAGAAAAHGEQAWQEALAYMNGQGKGMRVALGADA